MWVQREAQSVGKSLERVKPRSRKQGHPKPSEKTTESESQHCEGQDYLPLVFANPDGS